MKNLRRVFASLRLHKKILNLTRPFFPLINIKNKEDEILDLPFIPHPWSKLRTSHLPTSPLSHLPHLATSLPYNLSHLPASLPPLTFPTFPPHLPPTFPNLPPHYPSTYPTFLPHYPPLPFPPFHLTSLLPFPTCHLTTLPPFPPSCLITLPYFSHLTTLPPFPPSHVTLSHRQIKHSKTKALCLQSLPTLSLTESSKYQNFKLVCITPPRKRLRPLCLEPDLLAIRPLRHV